MAQSGCSLVSINPAWELVKGATAVTASAGAVSPPQASDTVYHGHAPLSQVCIEVNRGSAAADVLPALQGELLALGLSSRVYEAGSVVESCQAWLSYEAYIEWSMPPWGDDYEPNLVAASLVLRDPGGAVLASSRYAPATSGWGRWASTRKKIAPVVRAVMTGISSEVASAQDGKSMEAVAPRRATGPR